MVGGLPEGVGGAGWRGERGKNRDNCNSIINKIKKKIEKETKADGSFISHIQPQNLIWLLRSHNLIWKMNKEGGISRSSRCDSLL